MNDELTLFAVDPRKFKVMCSEEQMKKIYEHHPELKNFWATEKDIEIAITKAQVIYQSVKGEEFNVYYLSRIGKNTELKVTIYMFHL